MFFKSQGHVYGNFRGVLPKSDAYEKNFSKSEICRLFSKIKNRNKFYSKFRQMNKIVHFKKWNNFCENKYSLKNFFSRFSSRFIFFDIISSISFFFHIFASRFVFFVLSSRLFFLRNCFFRISFLNEFFLVRQVNEFVFIFQK